MFRKLICIVLLSVMPHGYGVAAEISIRFEDIGDYALANSPHAKILEKDLDFIRADRDASLRWSNPELLYELEQVKSGSESLREYSVLLEKEFAMPWITTRNRAGWNLRLEAARHTKTAQTWHLLSMLRRGYVELKIYEREMDYLEEFELLMERASKISGARKLEGTISGMEQHLIEMSLLGIRRRIHGIRTEYRTLLAEWKIEMGIPAEDGVRLETEMVFKQKFPDSSLKSVSEKDETADLLGRRLSTEALGKSLQMEKGGLLPSVTITGGYKNAEDTFEGFVVGLKMPIPLLNRNTGQVERVRTEYVKAKMQLDLYQSERRRRIHLLIENAEEKSGLLGRYSEKMEKIDGHIEDLVESYSEGWLTLAGLLEGIEIYTDGIENYFGLLGEYFAAIFELETLTERELVNSALAEGEAIEQ
ncbi:MAG: TolC family protein [bacterium]|nr:MAG: TolC family protein [bacterium]